MVRILAEWLQPIDTSADDAAGGIRDARPGRLRETGKMSDWSHVRPHELEPLARRAQVVQANAAVIRETQARVCGHVDCDAVLMALHDGRRN